MDWFDGFKIGGFIVVFLLSLCGISWLFTCGIIKLITVCFGLQFSWKIATGIWLILILLSGVFKKVVEVNQN